MTDAREILLRNQLQKVAIEQKYDDPVIETAAVPTTGSNFTSQLFHATIKSTGKRDLNVFAKAAVVGEVMRDQVGVSNFYDVEPHFYTSLGKRYKEIEEKHHIPEENRLVTPKFYGHSDDFLKEILLLQDMSKDGFVTYDRFKSIDWDYASKATEQMAKFHALSIAHQKEYPEDYEKAKKVFKSPMMDNGALLDMFKKTAEQVIPIIREENRIKMQQFLNKVLDPESFNDFYLPRKRPVIIHSDYKQSNLMHKIDEDGKLQVVIVDYQTMHPGSVAIDLLYFIFTGSDGAFRAQYYDQLIEHYYDSLSAALRRLNLDPKKAFPRTLFDEELKEMLPFGLTIASLVLPMITIDVKNVTRGTDGEYETDSLKDMADMMSTTNPLCARRLNEVVDDYIKLGVI